MPPENPQGPAVRWDDTAVRSSACDLASVRRLADGLAIGFGASRPRSGGDIGLELLHRVHLEPVAAQRLRDLLVKLVAEHEARYRGPR